MEGDKATLFFCLFVVHQSSVLNAEIICATQLSPCSCKTNDGKFVDLSSLSTGLAPRFSSTSAGYIYQWDPCRQFDCSTKKVSACQATFTKYIYPIGLQKTAKFGTDANGLFLQYDDGEAVRSCKVYLKCSPSATTPKYTVQGEVTHQHYQMTLEAKEVCPVDHGGGGGGGGGSSSGLSVGDILLIVFFVVIIIYVVIGLLVNIFVRKESGTNAIPNKAFWILLPGLVRDGGTFVFTKTKGLVSKDGNYQQM